MFDIDKLSLIRKSYYNKQAIGYSSQNVFDFNYGEAESFKDLTNKEKEIYWKNYIYETILNTIEDVNNLEHLKHMFTPIKTDNIKKAAEEKKKDFKLNVLLPLDKYKMVEAVGIGRTATGIFANSAKMQAFLNNFKLPVPITLNGEGFNFNFKEINTNYTGNLLLIDEFINSAIDNLKELSLSVLGVNSKSLPTVSTLLVLGVNNVNEIVSFIKRYGLDKHTLLDVIENSLYPVDVTDTEKNMLKLLQNYNDTFKQLIPILSIVSEKPSSLEDLMSIEKIIVNYKKIGATNKRKTLFDNTLNYIIDNQPQIKTVLSIYNSLINVIKNDYPQYNSNIIKYFSEILKDAALKNDTDTVSDIQKFLFNYHISEFIQESNLNKLLSDYANDYAAVENKGLLANKVVAYGSSNNKKLLSLLGKENALQLALIESSFSKLNETIQQKLLIYAFLSKQIEGVKKSIYDVIPAATIANAPVLNNKTLLTLLKEFEESYINIIKDISGNEQLSLLILTRFGKNRLSSFRKINKTTLDKTELINANKNLKALKNKLEEIKTSGTVEEINKLKDEIFEAEEKLETLREDYIDKAYNVENVEDTSDLLTIADYIKPVYTKLKVTKIQGKDVYYDAVVEVNKEKLKQDTLKAIEKKGEDFNYLSTRAETILNEVFAPVIADNGKIYIKVAVDFDASKAYYQIANDSLEYLNKKVKNYKIDDYFNPNLATVYVKNIDTTITNGFFTNADYGNTLYIVPEGNVDRTGRVEFVKDTSYSGVDKDNKKVNKYVVVNKVDETSYAIAHDFTAPEGVTSIIEKLDPYTKKNVDDIVLKSQIVNNETLYTYQNMTFKSEKEAKKAIQYARDKRKLAGIYSEAVVRKVLFNEDISLDGLLDGLETIDKNRIIKSLEYLSTAKVRDPRISIDKDNKISVREYILLKLGIQLDDKGNIINGRLVGLNPDGTINRNTSNRRFTNDKLGLSGEVDFLFEHDVIQPDGTIKHVYTLLDAKNSYGFNEIDTNNAYNLTYGKNLYGVLDNSYKSKSYLQLSLYAMALREANPDIQFKDILILPTQNEAALNYVKENYRPNLGLTLTAIKDLYKDNGIELDTKLIDPVNYDYKPKITKDNRKRLEELTLEMARISSVLESTKDFDVNNKAGYTSLLNEYYNEYKELTSNNIFINTTQGIDTIPMYIGSMASQSEKNIGIFNRALQKARSKAIVRKENMYNRFRKFLDAYLISEGYKTEILHLGNYDVYQKLYDVLDNGQVQLKTEDKLDTKEAKDLVRFLNNTYKEFFDFFSNDLVNFNPDDNNFISSIEYQNKVLKDDIRWYEGWIPKVSKSQAEYLRTNLQGDIKSKIANYVKYMYNKYLTFTFEKSYERMDLAEDMSIVMKYANERMNNVSNISMDIERQFDLFISWSIHKQEMIDVYALGKSMQAQLNASNNPGMKNVVEFLDKHIKLHIKQIRQNEVRASKNHSVTLSATKIAYLMSSFAGSMILSLNFIGGAKNTFQIATQYFRNDVRKKLSEKWGVTEAEKYFTHGEDFYKKGIPLALKAMYEDMKTSLGKPNNDKMMMMFRQLGFSAKYSSLSANYHRRALSGTSKFLSKIPTLLYSVPEEILAMATMYSSMSSIKHNGKSLYDWYEVENGELVWKGGSRGKDILGEDIIGITSEELSKMKYITELTNGTYREDERTIMDYYMFGQLIIAFKRTLYSFFRQQARGTGYQDNLGNLVEKDGVMVWEGNNVEGRWWTLIGVIARMLKVPGYESYALSKLSPEHKVALTDLASSVLFAVSIGALSYGLLGDDKDKLTGQIANSMQTDLINNVVPYSVLDVTPVAFKYATNFTGTTLSASINGLKALLGFEDAYTQDGYLRGSTQFYKLLPGAKIATQLTRGLEDDK